MYVSRNLKKSCACIISRPEMIKLLTLEKHTPISGGVFSFSVLFGYMWGYTHDLLLGKETFYH